MAKKKDNHAHHHHQTKPQENVKPQELSEQKSQPPAMDIVNPDEKFQSLKSLNAMLLKETSERRQQVDALSESKRALESELIRSDSERKNLLAALNRMGDEYLGFQMEKSSLTAFLKAQMDEMGVKGAEAGERAGFLEREIERVERKKEEEVDRLSGRVTELTREVVKEKELARNVVLERDEIRNKADLLAKRVHELRESVVSFEQKEKSFMDEVQRANGRCEDLVEENRKMNNSLELLERQLNSADMEARKLQDDLSRESLDNEKNKEVAELERSKQALVVKELEREVSEISDSVMALRDENEKLRAQVLELEKCRDVIMGQKEESDLEINVLKDEIKKNEMQIKMLMEEKVAMEEAYERQLEELKDERRKMVELVGEKNEIEMKSAELEAEITELKKDLDKNVESKLLAEHSVAELQSALDAAKQISSNQIADLNKLETEIARYRAEKDELLVDKDVLMKLLDEVRCDARNLSLKVSEMNERIKESAKEAEEMRNKLKNMAEAKTLLETQLESSVKERNSLESSLEIVQENIRSVKSELESAHSGSELALSMLKKTASVVCSASAKEANGKISADKEIITNEMQPYVTELEAIRNAFESKEMNVEDMKKQLEFLENSVAEAHKQKSFWTLMTSAATVFAAASVAYVARGGH